MPIVWNCQGTTKNRTNPAIAFYILVLIHQRDQMRA